jgi:hypothetical protein
MALPNASDPTPECRVWHDFHPRRRAKGAVLDGKQAARYKNALEFGV